MGYSYHSGGGGGEGLAVFPGKAGSITWAPDLDLTFPHLPASNPFRGPLRFSSS